MEQATDKVKECRAANQTLPQSPYSTANKLKIAEWPTLTGPADYVLFCGLIPVAVTEAKKGTKNVYSGAIDQAKCYAASLAESDSMEISTTCAKQRCRVLYFTCWPHFRPIFWI